MGYKHHVRFTIVLLIAFVIALGFNSCKKDDNPVNPGGGGGLTTINFTDPSPSVTIPAGTASTSFKLAGGTLPYSVASAANASVAVVTISSDTVTITAVGAGTTSVTIRDNSSQAPKSSSSPISVTVSITVSGTGGGGGTSGLFGDFPIPNVDNIGGVLGAADVISVFSGTTVEVPVGFAAFFGSTTSELVYGGNVSVNGSNLDTMNMLYMLPSAAHPTGPSLSFNGSSSASFNVAGAGSVPAFSASIVLPTPASLTSPAQNATVSRSSNLTLQWNGTGSDSIIILVAGYSGGVISKSGVPNNGSLTISSSELSSLSAGSGYITLVKYKYAIHAAGGKNYLLVAETVNNVFVTFN